MKLLWLSGLIVATLVACASDPSVTPVPEGALMAIQTRGGMCVDGACETTWIVERDGLVHVSAKPPNQLGVVPQEAMAELERQIVAADFNELRGHPFTGMCPTAVDGQEFVFEFNAPAGIERIESCRIEVDYGSPLFMAVTAAVGPFVSLPIAE